jgi:glycerol-3-phosphate acyltransferase PlsX
MSVTLAVDAMGGDHGLVVTVPASINLLVQLPDLKVRLVGNAELINKALAKVSPEIKERITVVHASEVVEMDDPIEVALRKKKDSSMRVAIEQVKEGLADGAVSAGNTGALMAISRYILKTLDGIDRPAIAAAMPNQFGRGTTVLDLGANSDCQAVHLLQFAQMGDVMARAVDGIKNPTIGLLNIGEEVIKGNEVVKEAAELLRASHLNFYGNVEGNDIFKGTTDIVVCDGFVGNVALKTTEGLAQMISGLIKEEFSRNWLSKLMALAAMPVLMRFKKRVDHRNYNGAVLLGLRGLVLKSHGSADSKAFVTALTRAYEGAKNNMVGKVAEAFKVTQAAAQQEGQGNV